MLRRGRRTHAHFPTLNTQGVFDSGTSTKHGGSRVLHMHIADFGAKRTSSCFSRLNVGPQARRTPTLPAPAWRLLLARLRACLAPPILARSHACPAPPLMRPDASCCGADATSRRQPASRLQC